MGDKNQNLNAAKTAKADEFYTPFELIYHEVKHNRKVYAGKTVLCNCDDPRTSEFFSFFVRNFDKLDLKKVNCVSYKKRERSLLSTEAPEVAECVEYTGGAYNFEDIEIKPLRGDGDFRNNETLRLLTEADIVATNPPFSLMREYVAQLMRYEKDFLILAPLPYGGTTAGFRNIQANRMRLGITLRRKGAHFARPSGELVKLGNVRWFTNFGRPRKVPPLELTAAYDEELHPHYDNYAAIEVPTIKDIPGDYDGVMGVPVSFLDRHNPEQFELLGCTQPHVQGGLHTKYYTAKDRHSPSGGDVTAAIKTADGYRMAFQRLLIRKIGA